MDTSCLYIAPVKRKVNPTFLQLSRPWRYFRLLMIIRACQLRILPATSQRVTDAVDALRRERIIAVPTDTLYGLAAGAHSDKSIRVTGPISHGKRANKYLFCFRDCMLPSEDPKRSRSQYAFLMQRMLNAMQTRSIWQKDYSMSFSQDLLRSCCLRKALQISR